MKGMEWNHFITILLLDPYFKIKGWIYRGILGVLVKQLLNLISFPLIPSNFGKNENLRFLGHRKEWVFSPTDFIHFHLGSAWEFIKEWNEMECI